MSNEVDKLFKSGLANHTLRPSAQAWGKIEAGLSKKNNGLIWFRWAAVFLVMITTTVVVFVWRTPVNTTTTAVAKKQIATPGSVTPLPATLPAQKYDNKSLQKTTSPVRASKALAAPLNTLETVPGDQLVEAQQPVVATTTVPPSVTEVAEQTAQPVNVNVTAMSTAAVEKPIVLEYTLDQIQPIAPVEKAITITLDLKEEKEKNGFRKVIDFARDAKNSEGPFAALRQAKNDLFAFNFKKEKTVK